MDKEKIAQGVTVLIHAKSFAQRTKQLTELVDGWEETPMLFAGALEPLNALVDVGLANREALDRLIALAASKRRALPVAKRVDYQRELMREKRDRLNRAVELEELVRGAPLRGAARETYKQRVQQKWMQERNEFVAQKGNLSWKERNEAANVFWQKLDAQLNHELQEARAVLSRPPMKRKRTVVVPKVVPVTALSKAFSKASLKKPTR